MSSQVSRRYFLGTAALLAASSVFIPEAAAELGHAVFQHGVASGDPLSDRVLLWTRITSHPDDMPGSLLGTPTTVHWEVSSDEDFSSNIAAGQGVATPEKDMTVKVDATGLLPHTNYFYRFTVVSGPYSGQRSPVGRTKTAPSEDQAVSHLRFAFFSCANWEAGYYAAYRDMAQRQDIDYALCLGDYLYEYATGEYPGKDTVIRPHVPPNELLSLADYRARYGVQRTDADLQAAHAACPWIVTWDDHEVADNFWEFGAKNHSSEEGDFIARREAAMQAYLEWLPVRTTEHSPSGKIYRNLSFGSLVELSMLDLRSYRSQQIEFHQISEIDNEQRTLLGSEQFQWLNRKLSTSNSRWNLIGNSVMIAPLLIPPLDPEPAKMFTELLDLPEEGMPVNTDQWDGYAAERKRLFKLLQEQDLRNVVWLTGDLHSSWASDVPITPGDYPNSGIVGVEFAGPSVSAKNGDDILQLPERNSVSTGVEQAVQELNPHIKSVNLDNHGYCVLNVTHDFVQNDWIYVKEKEHPESPTYWSHSFRAYHGRGIEPYHEPIR
ncbi:alkaline phosphatase D family protein [Corynebacterium freiburgense]|uniref:alkaline phosphatase D family protein n=1 Tax=Corynebacterium freiburgense TaxID=556548 RepID=UPI000A0227B3|nr:alkaline phosphatase D family protein [Corynebacterium freiburgense]WJZ03804.1 Phospholipase D precursor [Corynebacterium freiburgense]